MNDPRLHQLGDQLQSAVERRAARRAAPRTAVAVVAGLVVVAAAFAVLSLVEEDAAVQAMVPTVVDDLIPADAHATSGGTASPDLLPDGDTFAHAVFAHLPPGVGANPTCTGTGEGRYRCTVEEPGPHREGAAVDREQTPSPRDQEVRLLFRDRSHVTGGACRPASEDLTVWECATNEVAVDDGLLAFDELVRLTDP